MNPFQIDADYLQTIIPSGDSSSDHGFNSTLIGPKGLIAAILNRAIEDLTHKDKIIKRTAVAFLRSNEVTGCNEPRWTFLSICQYLDLEPAGIRAALRKRELL